MALVQKIGQVTLTKDTNPVESQREDDPLPIRLHSRRLACENTVFSVYLDHVSGAHGHEVLEYLSVFPKSRTKDMVTGVGVLPVRDGKFGLMRMFRHPLARWSWEMPRGMVDRGETADQAALRELREETGFTPRNDQLCEFGTVAPAAALIDGRVRLYFAMLNSSDTPGAVEHELGHGETKFFSREQIIDLIKLGEIEDACTMSVLLMYCIKQGCWAEGADIA